MGCEPLVGLLPDHAPEAVHEVVLGADQERIELLPLATVLGLAVRLIVGTDALTDTVVDCVTLPPAPLQVRLYVEVLASAPVGCDPLLGSAPDHAPEAVHDEALVADQVSIELPLPVTVPGFALRVTTGGDAATVTVTDCVAEPPSPVQASTKSVVFASAPVGIEPLTGIKPDQPPEAWHVVAFCEFQVSVEFAPIPTVEGSAVNVTTGVSTATTTAVDCVTDVPAPAQVSA